MPSDGSDPWFPPRRPTAGQQAGGVRAGSRIGGMSRSIGPPKTPKSAQQGDPSKQRCRYPRHGPLAGPDQARRPSPAGREGETQQLPRSLGDDLMQPASLFSEPKDLLPSPG